ncbi:MAG: chemotaxis protein CheW, partial [Fusobacteriota bacterium]
MNFDIYSDDSISLFLEDVQENLEIISIDILKLEKSPNNNKLINDIFRGLHSIKGAANILKYSIMGTIAHNLETIFGKIRNHKLEISKDITDDVLDGVQIMKIICEEIAETKKELSLKDIKSKTGINFDNYISKLNDISEIGSKINKTKKIKKKFKNLKNTKGANYEIRIELHEDDPMKKARFFIIYKNLSESFKVISSVPSEQDFKNDDIDENDINEFGIFNIFSDHPEEEIYNSVKKFTIKSFEILPINQGKEENYQNESDDNIKEKKEFHAKEYIKVEKGKLDKLFSIVGELFIEKNIYDQMHKKMQEISLELLDENISLEISKKINDYLDNYAITNKSQDRSLNSLQDISNSLRMVPLKSTFGKLPLAVRSLSQKLNKKIELDISGESTEIDKLLAAKLEDPLLHMIRNSVDHGIEIPEDRVKKGKSETGKIKIEAYNSGSNVVIKIHDDGKGLDPEIISKKALKEEIITSEELDNYTDQEKIELIFKPGFSTAKEVTDVSGRGVGMDVVKENIESIKGSVEIESIKGKGTTFYIKLPLTLAIIRSVLVDINNELFAFSSDDVVKIEKINKSEIKKVNGQKIINYRERAVPIIDLRDIYHKKQKKENDKAIYENLIILKQNKRMYGFRVSKFVNQKHIVVKDIEGNYHDGMSILGAAILGDGKVAMVLDANSLI